MALGRRIVATLSLAACAVLPLAIPRPALAGTTGRITGHVLDAKKQPLASANVAIVGVPLGAVTEADGRFSIFNVPAGTYSVRVGLIGYGPALIQNVAVSADQVTPLEVTLQESAVQVQEVVVSARRPVVDVNLTSNLASVTREEISKLPVQDLQDIVNLQAGVVDGHFRGGRAGEVQYQVDGVSVNNSFDNTSSVRIDRSLLEEVQVITGTFDAEYGQAMSGVVNAVLKRGTEKFEWGGEAFTGTQVYRGERRLQQYDFHPAGIQNYQLNASGPTGLPTTLYLLSVRRFSSDDYVTAYRVFEPFDLPDTNGVIHATGDQGKEPLGFTHEWSGIAKLTNRSIPHVELGYQALYNHIEGRQTDFAFVIEPGGLSRQHTVSLTHGIDLVHTLDPKSYYKLALRQNLFDYQDRAYDDFLDKRYEAGPPKGFPEVPGINFYGVQQTRFVQKTSTLLLNGSFTTQAQRDHVIKAGGEFQWPRLRFGQDGLLIGGGADSLYRYREVPATFESSAGELVKEYRPIIASAYAQDDLEWNDLRIRGGLRFEFFDPRAFIPSDLANPANSIAGQPESHLKDATNKLALMPRLGVSHPITSRASVFFAYGHFTQMPPLRDLYTNADYSVLANLQATQTRFGVLGNPDIKPERTVQYQFGYKQALSDQLGIDVTAFYKDIRDLLGVEFVSTYNDAEYARFANGDFGNVLGFTLAIDQRSLGPFSAALDYTWQRADGNTSDPRETATRAQAGEDARPELIPLNWDQRHTLNMTLTLARPEVYSVSSILRLASGQPYTPELTTGFSGGIERNSGRKPNAFLVDLRGEKQLTLGGFGGSVFARVFNLFDTRFFNGFVFPSTGDPYTSPHTVADHVKLVDPTRFYGPRRIELGLTMSGGAR